MIDISFGTASNGKMHACLFLPSIALSWFEGGQSYGLSFAWLRWSLTVAWGKGTPRP